MEPLRGQMRRPANKLLAEERMYKAGPAGKPQPLTDQRKESCGWAGGWAPGEKRFEMFPGVVKRGCNKNLHLFNAKVTQKI